MPRFSANILTALPEFFPGTLELSLAGKALKKGLWDINVFDIRAFAENNRTSIDDTPYGGGGSMLLGPEAIGKAIDYIITKSLGKKTKLIYMSPAGQKLDQKIARELLNYESLTILCGRFEGVDQRVLDFFNFFSLSIGDYVLSGGELAATVLLDACVRMLPGVVGNYDSIENDSFGDSWLLECPQYTRPQLWRELPVPEVLLSGDHKKIKEWREHESLKRTMLYRPDLLSCKKRGDHG